MPIYVKKKKIRMTKKIENAGMWNNHAVSNKAKPIDILDRNLI